MTRAPSLHELSVTDAVRASVERTPDKAAIVEGTTIVRYRDLLASHPQAGTSALATIRNWFDWFDWLGRPNVEPEQASFVTVSGATLTHRVLMMRVLNTAMVHRAFSRDVVSASLLPLNSAAGVVAAMAPLILGGTLHCLAPSDISALARSISAGFVNQAWIGTAALAELDRARIRDLDAPHPDFRLLIATPRPGPIARGRLLEWLGAERVTAESGDDTTGPVLRYPGLMDEAEPFDGASLAATLS